MAASAHVITMGLDKVLNANIKAWFSQFNFLPPIPLTAAQIDAIPHDLTFEHLLELVIQSTYTNFIFIIHGQPDGSGLYLPFFRNSSKADTFHYDLQKLMDVDAKVSTMSDADFRVMVDMFGTKVTRGSMLVNQVICGHAAYRTQLFCYLKSCGRDELNTMNLWAGMDGPG